MKESLAKQIINICNKYDYSESTLVRNYVDKQKNVYEYAIVTNQVRLHKCIQKQIDDWTDKNKTKMELFLSVSDFQTFIKSYSETTVDIIEKIETNKSDIVIY